MNVKLDSLIPYEKLISDLDNVLQVVDKNGKAVLLKDNQPVYIIIKYDDAISFYENSITINSASYKLHEAMKIVLLEAEDRILHASVLSEEIYKRGLYLKKNGCKAESNQIRSRCGHYPNMFETLPGNYIKLKDNI